MRCNTEKSPSVALVFRHVFTQKTPNSPSSTNLLFPQKIIAVLLVIKRQKINVLKGIF